MNTSILLLILIVLIIILVIKKLSKEPFGKKIKKAFGGKKKKKKKKFDKDEYDESRKFVDKFLWSKINTIDDIEINNQIMTNINNITNFIE